MTYVISLVEALVHYIRRNDNEGCNARNKTNIDSNGISSGDNDISPGNSISNSYVLLGFQLRAMPLRAAAVAIMTLPGNAGS